MRFDVLVVLVLAILALVDDTMTGGLRCQGDGAWPQHVLWNFSAVVDGNPIRLARFCKILSLLLKFIPATCRLFSPIKCVPYLIQGMRMRARMCLFHRTAEQGRRRLGSSANGEFRKWLDM